MRNLLRKGGLVMALALAGLMALAGSAFAAADATVVTNVGTAAEGLKDTLVAVGGTVLPYAAAVVGLGIAWRFARKFVRG